MSVRLILCDCAGTQQIDAEVISKSCEIECSRVHTELCTREIAQAAELIGQGNAVVACGQEHAVFSEIAAELGQDSPGFVDIRDRAGWSSDGRDGSAKMAALVADALLPRPAAKTTDVHSEGTCLVFGRPETVFEAAGQLSTVLAVTVLVDEVCDLPLDRRYDVIQGHMSKVSGTIGNFKVTIRDLRQLKPGGRGEFGLGDAAASGESECDLILDLSGRTPLFSAPGKRDGYVRADPGDPLAVARAVFDVSHLVGTFEKPLYIAFDPHICAHSRAGQIGCTRCLDVCPTGAIEPDGDHVTIDPMICAGCGACAAVCPSGAASYDDPPVGFMFRRIETISRVYREAGGDTPRLLVHDEEHGAEMISLSARFGGGLPADVIPLAIENLSVFGHAEMLAAVATGFATLDILLSPKTEREVLEREAEIANAIIGRPLVRLLDIDDPDGLSESFVVDELMTVVVDPVLPLGGRREVARLSAKALRPDAAETPIELPTGSPYGSIDVDIDACTLCLSCASLCPAGAIGDNPELPQLRFQEDACLQCGLCANICPESAISLRPRMDLSDAAFRQRVLHEEEPFACIECGSPFGVRSTVERIFSQLAGKHSMFAESTAGRLIRMCDDCRVKAQYHGASSPMRMGERPRVRTTADYMNGEDTV